MIITKGPKKWSKGIKGSSMKGKSGKMRSMGMKKTMTRMKTERA